jgi:hypothetical protein
MGTVFRGRYVLQPTTSLRPHYFPVRRPTTSVIVDDFDDNTIDAAVWDANYGTVSEVGGRARVANTSAHYSGYQTSGLYRFNELLVEVPTYPTLGGAATECYFAVWVISAGQATGTQVGFFADLITGNLSFANRTAGTDPGAPTVTVDAAQHRWFSLALVDADLIWRTSPDGFAWITRRTIAAPTWLLEALDCRIQMEAHRDSGTIDYVEFDNFNVAATVVPDATAAPAAVPGAATVGGAALSGAVATPVAITRTATIGGTATASTAATAAPGTVSGTATIADPTETTGATAAPAAVTRTVTIGSSVGAVSATVASAGLTRPAPSIGAAGQVSAAASPATLTRTVTVPAPSPSASATAATAGFTRPAPTIGGTGQGGATVAVAAVTGTATVAATATGGDFPPTAPTGLTSTAVRATEVDLVWNPSTDDVAVIGYEVVLYPL